MGLFKKFKNDLIKKAEERKEIREIERKAAYEERKKQARIIGKKKTELKAQRIIMGQRKRLGLSPIRTYSPPIRRYKTKKKSGKKGGTTSNYVKKRAYKPNLEPRKQDQDIINYIMKM